MSRFGISASGGGCVFVLGGLHAGERLSAVAVCLEVVGVNPCAEVDVVKVNKSACGYGSFRDSVVLVKVTDDISTSTFTGTMAHRKQQQSMMAVLKAFFALTAAAGSALGLALTQTFRDPYLLAVYLSLAGITFVGAVGEYTLLRPRRTSVDSDAGS